MSFESSIEAVILEILAQNAALAQIPRFEAVTDNKDLPCPRIVAAAKDDGEDTELRLPDGRYMRNASCRVIFTAPGNAAADWIVLTLRHIEAALDDPDLPIAALSGFDHFTIISRGESATRPEDHNRISETPLTFKAMLTA